MTDPTAVTRFLRRTGTLTLQWNAGRPFVSVPSEWINHLRAETPTLDALISLMENEGVVTWGDQGHRARFLAALTGDSDD